MEWPSRFRSSRSRRRGFFGRDRWRALVAGASLVILLASGALLAGNGQLGDWSSSLSRFAFGRPEPKLPADDDLATGSILIVPLSGENCRQLLIDNATWRIRDQGLIDCHTALVRSGSTRQLSAARVEVMRAVFGRR
jgi:hypothetical protein